MAHRLPPCRRTSHRARLPAAAARSSPVCPRLDRSRSSSPCTQARALRLPARYFPICAFSLSLLIGIPLCNLCVLCVSVVNCFTAKLTTETQRTQRLHRVEPNELAQCSAVT